MTPLDRQRREAMFARVGANPDYFGSRLLAAGIPLTFRDVGQFLGLATDQRADAVVYSLVGLDANRESVEAFEKRHRLPPRLLLDLLDKQDKADVAA